jgi:menaquinol-cytochrome c reductase iron-sulfur subunit
MLDPLGRKKATGSWLRVTSLDSVPPDGKPYRFPVIDQRRDAWNLHPPEPVGSVYLRRTEEGTLESFSAVCPHLGCTVDFRPSHSEYWCPCHNSRFQIDGKRTDAGSSPSPRDLDALSVEVRDEDEIWVEYRRFKSGTSERVEE